MLISWEVWFLYGLSVLFVFMLALLMHSLAGDYE
jgi:hypothetical protein